MKAVQLACFCLGVVSAFGQFSTSSTNAVAIAGFGVGGERTRYTVPASDLPCPVTWNPESDPFPEELRSLVARASSFLKDARQLGGSHGATRFDLDNIQIKRIELTPRQINAIGKEESAFTNQWFVAVTFHGADPVDLTAAHPVARKNVVLLLDGTWATEENDPLQRPKWSATNFPPVKSISNTLTRIGLPSSSQDTDSYGKLSKADLPISKVQWDHFGQQFPLDLRAQASRAKDYLMSSPDSPQRLTLTEICLWRYKPIEALRLATKPTTEHLHDWEAVFWFRDERRQEHDVHMLLDTTILPKTDTLPDR